MKEQKKNAAIITVHVGPNFGSNLQTIATTVFLKTIGIEPYVLNYIPPRVTYKRYFNNGMKNIKALLSSFYYLPNKLLNDCIYSHFLHKHCKITKAAYNYNDLLKVCPQVDYFITGSDQVWNTVWNEGVDEMYFWSGVDGKKIAFASSFGNTELTENQKKIIVRLLSPYTAISVREDNAVSFLKELGISATQLLDPTFMINREEWRQFASKKTVGVPYILVYLPYSIAEKSLIYDTVRLLSKKKGLKIITFSTDYSYEKMADKTLHYASPGDFLSLMLNAEYVVTNSFHGTAFSINLNKQFWVYLPSRFSQRVKSIIDLCGLQDRILDSIINEDQIEKIIDYGRINVILENEREKSRQFMKKSLCI